jgi:hypothetical protein
MSQPQTPSTGQDARRRRHRGWIALDDALAACRPDLEPVLRSAGIATLHGEATGKLSAPGLLVFGGGQPGSADGTLARAEDQRRRGRSWAIALVVDALTEAQARWASRLTPFVYPSVLSAGALAGFLCAALERADAPRRMTDRARCVTIRPGEEVSIDGVPASLGVAERNFLFMLAWGSDVRVAKDARIPVGRGPGIRARECRRRLGRRLGAELASLLVPDDRGDPYRLRSPAEIERACATRPALHPMTHLSIKGRATPRGLQLPDIDRIPG